MNSTTSADAAYTAGAGASDGVATAVITGIATAAVVTADAGAGTACVTFLSWKTFAASET